MKEKCSDSEKNGSEFQVQKNLHKNGTFLDFKQENSEETCNKLESLFKFEILYSSYKNEIHCFIQ